MRSALIVLGVLLAAPSIAAYQVRAVPVKVAPFYEAAEHREEKPRVATSSGFDRQLASLRAADIAAVRDAVRAEPAAVSPITLMVLAIRLYDVGLRDDAVFWFHAARARMATAAAVLDTTFQEIAKVEATTRAFALQAGPTINGYALCEPARHARSRRAAIDWVEANPYATIFIETIPAKPGDRRETLSRALRDLRAEAAEDEAALAKPEEQARLAQLRRETRADEKYCWR
jgi:hypothetical protein